MPLSARPGKVREQLQYQDGQGQGNQDALHDLQLGKVTFNGLELIHMFGAGPITGDAASS